MLPAAPLLAVSSQMTSPKVAHLGLAGDPPVSAGEGATAIVAAETSMLTAVTATIARLQPSRDGRVAIVDVCPFVKRRRLLIVGSVARLRAAPRPSSSCDALGDVGGRAIGALRRRRKAAPGIASTARGSSRGHAPGRR